MNILNFICVMKKLVILNYLKIGGKQFNFLHNIKFVNTRYCLKSYFRTVNISKARNILYNSINVVLLPYFNFAIIFQWVCLAEAICMDGGDENVLKILK